MNTLLFYTKLIWENIRMTMIALALVTAGAAMGISMSSLFSDVAEGTQTWVHTVIPAAGIITSALLAGYLILRLISKQVATEQKVRKIKEELKEMEKTLSGDEPEKPSRVWFGRSRLETNVPRLIGEGRTPELPVRDSLRSLPSWLKKTE